MPIKYPKTVACTLFPADTISTGILHSIRPSNEGHRLHYEHPHGKLFQGDCIDWLASLEPESVDLIFADPPYNLKKADWDNFENQEHHIEWSLRWIEPAAKTLKPTGS